MKVGGSSLWAGTVAVFLVGWAVGHWCTQSKVRDERARRAQSRHTQFKNSRRLGLLASISPSTLLHSASQSEATTISYVLCVEMDDTEPLQGREGVDIHKDQAEILWRAAIRAGARTIGSLGVLRAFENHSEGRRPESRVAEPSPPRSRSRTRSRSRSPLRLAPRDHSDDE